jgi:hypothetical protein
VLLAAAMLGGCGADSNAPPTAINLSFSGMEETPVDGALQGNDPEAQPITYRVTKPPAHGSATVDAATGQFTYVANVDYFGADSFTYTAFDGTNYSPPASVRLSIANVNDAPVLGSIPDLNNSAETHDLNYLLPVTDVDGDPLAITVHSDSATVATVTASEGDRSLVLSPGSRGRAQIHVMVSDGQLSAERTFNFSVGDVTKSRSIAMDSLAGDAVTLFNTSSAPVTLTLKHNAFPMFQSDAEIVDFVRAMSPRYTDEPFERKLWRFVRDSVYHHVPLNNDNWLYDPWVMINSLGWGFCGHTAATYVRLSRAAGYEARIWGLTGHVIPEIKIAGRWEMFDPDLAVYYLNAQRQIAGAEELMADPTLISNPVDPIFANTSYDFPYSGVVTAIYATTADNFNADDLFLATSPSQYQAVELPAGARLVYPGRWTESVIGVDGTIPYNVPYYLQAALTIPANFSGELPMPWMIWEIRGAGRVRVAGAEYDVGSQQLIDVLHQPGAQISTVEVVSATSELEFIFFINAMTYGLEVLNDVSITGKDVWAVAMGTETLSEPERTGFMEAAAHTKPVAGD